MSDRQNIQHPPKGWGRASASPMRGNPRFVPMSPTPVMRQRSPTPTFNAHHLTEAQIYNPSHQSPTPPLRHMPSTPTGFTTIYDSQMFSSSHSDHHQHEQQRPSTSHLPKISKQPENSMPRPFCSVFSPVPSASTPCSIPTFSPTPSLPYDHQSNPTNDFYVVPLEPTNASKGIVVFDENDSRPSTADIIAQQSQDYVDEKLAEYQATISLLQGMMIYFLKTFLSLFSYRNNRNSHNFLITNLKSRAKSMNFYEFIFSTRLLVLSRSLKNIKQS